MSRNDEQKKRYFLIVNPVSGVKKGLSILKKVEPLFHEAGIEISVITSEQVGHIQTLANTLDLEKHYAICVIGGDGSMHELVNGLMTRKDRKKCPIGLIPGGTGNSFMHDLNCLDPLEATEKIITGNKRWIDIAKIKMKEEIMYAFNIIGWGLPVSINILAEKLRWLGGQRYNIASLLEIMRNPVWHTKISLDGQSVENTYCLIMACNTVHTGKGMKIAPRSVLDDGLMDLVLLKKTNRINLISLFSRIFEGKHMDDPLVEYHQVRSFSLTPKKNSLLNIDGQLLGNTPIKVKMLARQLEIFA